MAREFYPLLQPDLNIGTDVGTKKSPGGGTLTGVKIGLHTFARNQQSTSAVWAPGSVAVGGSQSTTISYPGAIYRDTVVWSFEPEAAGLQGCQVSAYVSAPDTVTIVVSNLTGSPVTIGSGTWRILALPVR